MRLFRRSAALALLLLAAAPAYADIALPNRPKTNRNGEVRRDLPYSRMSIERVEGLREARLQIPRAQLERLNVAAGAEGGAQSGFFNSAGTVVAGLFLSLGVMMTGLLLLRRTRRGLGVGRAAAAALVVCVSAAGLAAVAAYANAGPPPGYMPQDPGTLIKAVSGAPLAGSIRVEVVEGGGEIKLLVPARTTKGGEEEE